MGSQWEEKELFVSFFISIPSIPHHSNSSSFRNVVIHIYILIKLGLEFKSPFGLGREFTARKRCGQIYLSAVTGSESQFQDPMCPAEAAELTACPGAATHRGFCRAWLPEEGWKAGAGAQTELSGTV